MVLTKEQKEQVAMQLKKHNRKTVKSKIELEKDVSLDLIVENGVFGSDIMSSGIYLAKFLYQHKELYENKICLDMGCGPGTQGLVMALYGAMQVDFSDINSKAVKNTQKNIELNKLKKTCHAYTSDLFAKIPKERKYDVIVFNHPFFPEDAEKFGDKITDDVMLRKSMLGGTKLIHSFLKEVKGRLKSHDSILIMAYFHFAGPANDPANYVSSYGLTVDKDYRIDSDQGLQKGDFSMYVIKQK